MIETLHYVKALGYLNDGILRTLNYGNYGILIMVSYGP